MIVATPPPTPVTTPLSEPTEALAVLLLLHEPPETASVNVITEPAHTEAAPLMEPGTELTDTIVVAVQPVASE